MTDVGLRGYHGGDAGWASQAARAADTVDRRAAQRREHRAYFALLLALELPVALVAWSLRAARHGRLPSQGPLAAARSRAALVTSLILSV